jgi:hypothetical protein
MRWSKRMVSKIYWVHPNLCTVVNRQFKIETFIYLCTTPKQVERCHLVWAIPVPVIDFSKIEIALTLVQHTLLDHSTQCVCNNLGYGPNLRRRHTVLKSQSCLLSITKRNGMFKFQSFLKNNRMGSKFGFSQVSWTFVEACYYPGMPYVMSFTIVIDFYPS